MYLTYNVKQYFDKIVDFNNKSVLDFGCNQGNFLLGERNYKNYTGLDIDENIIKSNNKNFPEHNWLHYKNYNWQYNVNYTDKEWPTLNHYDVAVAYSVFTHTDFVEFYDTVSKLTNTCDIVLPTFLSNLDKNNIKEVLQHRSEYFDMYTDDLVEQIYNKKTVSVLVTTGKQIHVIENMHNIPHADNTEYMLTFYNDDWLKKKFSCEIVDVTPQFDGILGTQKCLKLYTAH